MPQEFIIGRSSASSIKVPADKEAVSGNHVKITISDNGDWYLEDLNTPNGTYIKDENGDFQRVFNLNIRESDVIRLGNGGVNSFIFTAHRVIEKENSYEYEFRQLKKRLARQREEEAEKEKRIELNGWISKCSGLVVILICGALGYFGNINIDPNVRYVLIACAPVVVGLIFNGDSKKFKALKKRRERILVCPNPKCGKPLTEFDIEQGQCSRCKSK